MNPNASYFDEVLLGNDPVEKNFSHQPDIDP